MSLLIDFVDEILVRWNPLLQNLITSAMAGNWLLLKKEASILKKVCVVEHEELMMVIWWGVVAQW